MAYITLGDLKNYLGVTEEDDDHVLEQCIDRAEAAIDTYTGRTFEAATGTRSYGWEAVDGLWLWLDYDLYSLDSVANGDSSGTAIAVADITEFPINDGPPYHRLRLDDGSASVWEVDTDYWIEVTGDWGYSASAPNDIVLACVRWASYLYQQKDAPYTRIIANAATGMVELPQDIAADIKLLLDPYVRRSL